MCNHPTKICGSVGVFLAATALSLTMALQSPARANDDLIEVFPTGDPGEDIGSIQDAVAMVAEGGTVLLKATAVDGTPTPFNFGQDFPDTLQEAFDARDQNSVNIMKSLTIRGERLDDDWDDDLYEDDSDEDENEGARTTIFGGFEPIRVLTPGVDVVIEKLDFDCTRYKAIQVLAGGDVVIRKNRFGKMTFFKTDLVFGTPRIFGMAIASDIGDEVVPADSVLIEHNLIDLNPGTLCPGLTDDPDKEELSDKLIFGMVVTSVDANVVVQDNIVRNTPRFGIAMFDNRKTVLVRNNDVRPGPTAFGNPFFFGSAGISLESGFFLPDEGQRGLTIISRNHVVCGNKDCRGIGVGDTASQRGRAIVLGNRIQMKAPELPDLPFAAGIEVFIGNSIVAFNKIEGQSNFAILLEGDIGTGVGDLANDNRIFGNNVGNFTPLSTDYFGIMLPEPADYVLSSANDNLLAGRSGKVFDLGQGNVIKGGLEVINGGS